MKELRKLFAAALLAAIVISGGPRGSSAAAMCTTTLTAGSDIQAAIDAATAGDVICLEPGIYSPTAKINIDKSITLQGPQAGVDPRPSAGTTRTPGNTSTEAIIDGAAGGLSGIVVIKADNVVLDGLEVRNGSGDLIDSESSIPTTGTVLRYNIIRNASGDEGVQLRNVQDGVIEYNHTFDIAQDGINMCCGSTGGAIQYNEVHNNWSENAAIYVYDAEQMTIQCNLVYDVFGNDGIKLGSKEGEDAGLSGGSILYNTVHNTAQDGISVYTSDTVVQGNEVHHSSSENGAIYVAWGVSNIDILYNDVHDNALNTGKWGDPGAIMIGTAVDASDVHVNYNNIYGNSPNGVTNRATAPLDATSNWWGAADGPSGAGPGTTGDAVSTNVDFDPWLSEPQVIVNPCIPDTEGPVTSDVVATPNPVAVAGLVDLTANVDDTATGGSNIASAEYTLDGGANWYPMDADPFTPEIDGFDSPTEDVAATFTAPSTAGIYNYTLCVRGTDGAGNTGAEECIELMLVVYDPDGGFVTGGGWIESPPGAYLPYFVETFDTDPPLSGTAVDGAWYPDRYPPATFESAFFDGGNRLHVHISADDWHGGTFYDFQGRKFNLGYGLDTYIMADLYIGEDWETHDRHASLWATTYDADGVISGYPIMGFTSGMGFRIFTQDLDQDTSNGYQSGWYDIGYPGGFQYGAWYAFRAVLTSSAYHYYINGQLVWTDVVTFDSVLWANMMLQAYNYGEDYDTYWDNVGAGPIGPTGKASFGFVSKYKKGASEPTGNTEFVFKAADLNFHSTSYDWLIVTGSDYARFKGSGTINGGLAPNSQEYRFMLWAGDSEPDTFRIKIWWEDETEHVVYDNGSDQAIAGGQIVIHTKSK